MCLRQCIATQLDAEYAWAAAASPMSSTGPSLRRVPGTCGSTGGLVNTLGSIGALAPSIEPPSICTVR